MDTDVVIKALIGLVIVLTLSLIGVMVYHWRKGTF